MKIENDLDFVKIQTNVFVCKQTHPNLAQKACIIYYSEVTKFCKKSANMRRCNRFSVINPGIKAFWATFSRSPSLYLIFIHLKYCYII